MIQLILPLRIGYVKIRFRLFKLDQSVFPGSLVAFQKVENKAVIETALL